MNPKTLELTLFGIAANRFDFYYGDFIKAYPDHRVIFRLGVARGVDTIIVEDDNFPGAVIAFASLYGEMDDKDFHVEVIRIKVGDIFPEYIGKTKDELRELGFSMTDLFPVSPMFPASPEAYYRTKEENITDSSDYMDYEKVGKWIGRIDAYYVISFFDNEFLSEDNFVYILPPTAFH